jgi:hypothetical protein
MFDLIGGGGGEVPNISTAMILLFRYRLLWNNME